MGGRRESDGGRRRITYCIVPRDLAGKLHEPLRRHFRDDPGVEVIVERRRRDRRRADDRRAPPSGERQSNEQPSARERRAIRSPHGRRAGDRRAALVEVEPPELPRRARQYAERLTFVARLEPSGERAEDLDTARAVTRFQAGDRDAFATLYLRYFDRVYSYLRVVFKDRHEAEDTTQQVFVEVLEGLPRYERRTQPFRAWLFTVVRNVAVNRLRERGRIELEGPAAIRRRAEHAGAGDPLQIVGWIADRDLVTFVERLPLPQRQVLVLRYMLDLRTREIAHILGRTPTDVRSLQYRALRFLRERLAAVGRTSRGAREIDMRSYLRQAPVLRMRRFALRP